MKKRLFTFCLAALLVTGCTAKTDNNDEIVPDDEPVEHTDETDEEMSQILTVDPAKFHFVAGWLTDTKIVYVEKDEGFYKVNSFDVHTGETDNLYEEKSMIIDVLIHPTKNYLLLHTSDDSTSATIKVLSADGVVQNEIEVASTELGIEWNDLDPSLILLTAFYQDWTFDLFLYNGAESYLGLLPVDDPFPKWFGREKIVVANIEDHVLDGGKLLTFDLSTEKWEDLDRTGIVYFDTYNDSLLTVRIDDVGDAYYILSELDGTARSEWTLPAVSNYSEWVIPEVEWVSSNTVYLSASATGGQLDELTSQFRLLQIREGQQKVIGEEVVEGYLRCSPSGQKCLTGTSLVTIIDVETEESSKWLEYLK
ncbi:hypothetical protein [Sporosarcina sp. NPDC096371]|uniref:YqgU-like beta propeller domain-containing protein n=1 Tax=Sporosarcina sp. NPDC096371 TaxID=3364530 RepID=UPI0038123ADF